MYGEAALLLENITRRRSVKMDTSTVLRILVVDDVLEIADSMAMLLELSGYRTAAVYDGEHALEFAREFRPDAVVLNIGLPGIDGFELAHRLRRLPGLRKTLLIAVTGYDRETDIRRYRKSGIDRYFLKPVDPDEIKLVLDLASQRKS
jgi:CheY-like chemotaxis protein